MFIFKQLTLVFVIYVQLDHLAANILSMNGNILSEIIVRFNVPFPAIHGFFQDFSVAKINDRFRLEVIAPFKSSIDSYNELFKAIWEIVKTLKDANSFVLPKIEEKHKKFAINFVVKLKQTSASSVALVTYITDLRQETSKIIEDVNGAQRRQEDLLKIEEANIVKFRNQVAVHNKKISKKQSEISSSKSTLRKLEAKVIQPEWYCYFALAWHGVCMLAEHLKKVKQKKNNIKKLEGELSIMRNGLNKVENSRDRINSQISDTKNSIEEIKKSKAKLQKYKEELNLRKDASEKIVEKLRLVVEKVHDIEAPGQNAAKTLEEQGEYLLASEDIMIQMEEIAQYITMFKSGSGEKLELTVTKEQMKNIRDVLAKSKKSKT